MKVFKKSIYPIVIVINIIISIPIIISNIIPSVYNYIGKVKVTVAFNGVKATDFSSTLYLFNDYTLEKVTKVNIYSRLSKNNINKFKTIPLHSDTLIIGYLLCNWENEKSVLFDTSLENLSVKKVYSTDGRPNGLGRLSFKNDKVLNGFVFKKDSLIDGQSVKLFVKSENLKLKDSAIKMKQILYLNPDLKDFPIHPVGHNLDDKLGGYIFRHEVHTSKGQDILFSAKFVPGLKSNKIKIFKKMIDLSGI